MEEKEETLRQKLRYDMRLRVSRTDHAFGPGVAELMEHVEATGSLSKRLQMHADGVLEGMENLKARRGGSRHPAGTGQPGRQQRRPDGTDPGGKRIPEAVPEV